MHDENRNARTASLTFALMLAIVIQFVYALWPPNPLVWNTASAGQVLTIHSSASVNNGYLALQPADDKDDYLVPVKEQAHPALEAGTFFRPLTPMIRWAVTKLPEGSYTVPFYAPTRWCTGGALRPRPSVPPPIRR